ncbi:MAG: GAF domain-containing protein [Armatimonadota bacterium]|nr:GAF domain-containing protein [Armatimonadota bacterium]MDR7444869.1 GAF domain-containing protein [Armatimonadota bacterium]
MDRGSNPQNRLEILLAVAEHLNRHTELQPMLDSTLPLILQLVGLPAGWIFLWEDEGFWLAAASGLPPGLEAEDRAALRWATCSCQQRLLEGKLPEPINLLECERLSRLSEGAEGLRLHVSVPLRTGDRTLGILNLAKADPEPLDRTELDLLRVIGEQLGVAVDRARLFARVKGMREHEEEQVSRLAQALVDASTLEEAARVVFETLRERLEPDRLALLVVDPSGTYLEAVAGWGWPEGRLEHVRLPLRPVDSSGPAWALHTGSPLLVDLDTAPYRIPEQLRQAGVRTVLLLPMLSGKEPIGVLVAHYFSRREVPEPVLRFCTLAARLAAGAVARVQEHLRYRLLFERVPVGLYRSTPTGQLLDVNEALVRIAGYPDRETLLRTNAAQLYVDPRGSGALAAARGRPRGGFGVRGTVAPLRRHGDLDPGEHPGHPGRLRSPGVLRGERGGHHGAEALPAGGHLPREPRPAHGRPQPPQLPGGPGAPDLHEPDHGPKRRPAVPGPGRVQGGQRPVRAPDRG